MPDRIKFLQSHSSRPKVRGSGELDRHSIERVLRTRCRVNSFHELEDTQREIAPGLRWRRRRMAWEHNDTGDPQGLCINELRLARDSPAEVRPFVAMASPGLVDFEAIENAYWQTTWASGAMRLARGEKASRLFLNMRELTCARGNAPRGPWEDLRHVQQLVADGLWNSERNDLIPYMNPVLNEVEGTELEPVRYLPAIPPSSCVQATDSILAATNGGYFLNFPEEYDDGLSALHQPVGALYSHDRLHMPPWIERPCALEWVDGIRRIVMLGPENIALRLDEGPPVPLTRGTYDPEAPATVWRSFDPPRPESAHPDNVVELVFSGSGLAAITGPNKHPVPVGGAIVRLAGLLAEPWLAWLAAPRIAPFPNYELLLQTPRDTDLVWALASGPKLVYEGRPLCEEEIFHPLMCGEFHPEGPPPTRFPYDAEKTRAPRTAIGINGGEDWVLVVVDGRFDPAHSIGLTLEELARLMAEIGCYFALNLDGGGSSVMSVEGIGHLEQLRPGLVSTIVNIPSDPGHRERIVPVALNVVFP